MKQIDKTHPIFQSKEYRKDRNLFHIIELNLQSDDVFLYSDEKSYVICRGAVGRPTWIWTVDGIEESAMQEVASLISEYYLPERTKCKFTTKKELYVYLKESNYPYLREDYFEMGALECHKVCETKACDGFCRKAGMEDIDVLAKYWFDDNQEMGGSCDFSMERAYEDVRAMLAEDSFFVWENAVGKIVCMVYYKAVGDQAKLNHVYTPKEERGKGYAANLIHDVTKQLLELHLEPLLYTDYNYAPSNRAYKNAGYQESGVLISFSCGKESPYSKNRAKALLISGEYTCVLCRDNQIYTSAYRGVKPLVQWLDEGLDVRDFSAADKVVGKATAFLYVLLGVKEVYAHVISQPALDVLQRSGIAVEAGTVVECVINRKGDGICPFEAVVMQTDAPQEAYHLIKAKMKELQIN